MNDDIYLNLVADLYNNGTWDKETVVRRVTLYAKEKNIDMTAINIFLDRLTKVKEYTIEDKRKILSVIKLGDTELKYGDVVKSMNDGMVEKFYKVEEDALGKDKIEKYYDLANNKDSKNPVSNEKKDEKVTIVPTVSSKPKELSPKDIKINGNVSLEDIIYGNYKPDDLLGITEKDSDEIFNKLVTVVDKKSFNLVVANFRSKLGEDYAKAFIKEWNKTHSSELEEENKKEAQENHANKGFHKPDPINDPSSKEVKQHESQEKTASSYFHAPEPLDNPSTNKENGFVIPKIFSDEVLNEKSDMPETEEEYKEQEKNITNQEKDSSVRIVNVSPERLEKLKRTKSKVINYALKTAIVIAGFKLLNPISATGLTLGYLYFASEIKTGNFNPTNPIGKAIKKAVEKVMNIGIKKDEKVIEGGKSK